jgi:hypothetical protein
MIPSIAEVDIAAPVGFLIIRVVCQPTIEDAILGSMLPIPSIKPPTAVTSTTS